MITTVLGYYGLVEDTNPERILKVPPVVILKTPPTFPKPAASATVPLDISVTAESQRRWNTVP